MRFRYLVALGALVAVLSSCGDIDTPQRITTTPTYSIASVPSTSSTTSTTSTTRPSTTTTSTTMSTTTSTTVVPITAPPPTAAPAPPTSSAGDYHAFADWPLWHCIGQHEQGAAAGGPYDSNGDAIAWHGSPAGGLPGSGYPGGLGIMREAWDDARDAAGVTTTNGAEASPAEQIAVARVILERHGLDAWATASICREYLR